MNDKNTELVECGLHGERPVTLVCQHIARAVDSGENVGFYWSEEDGSKYPDAWCNECNRKLIKEGEWNKKLFKEVSFKVFCSECYKEAREKLLKF